MTPAHNDPKDYRMTHAERDAKEGRTPTPDASWFDTARAMAVARALDADRPAAGITAHEGKKYLRTIRSCIGEAPIGVDVYAVLKAFAVTCPATAHAVKKLLCDGARGKGDRRADIVGAQAALARAIELLDEDEPK